MNGLVDKKESEDRQAAQNDRLGAGALARLSPAKQQRPADFHQDVTAPKQHGDKQQYVKRLIDGARNSRGSRG